MREDTRGRPALTTILSQEPDADEALDAQSFEQEMAMINRLSARRTSSIESKGAQAADDEMDMELAVVMPRRCLSTEDCAPSHTRV